MWYECGRGHNRNAVRFVMNDWRRYLCLNVHLPKINSRYVRVICFRSGKAWIGVPRPKQIEIGCSACPTIHRKRTGFDCVPSIKPWPPAKSFDRSAHHGYDPVSILPHGANLYFRTKQVSVDPTHTSQFVLLERRKRHRNC